MKRPRSKRSLFFISTLFAIFSLYEFQMHKVTQLNYKFLNFKSKQVCVGRFIIDVPDEAIVSYRPSDISGWTITTKLETSDDFDYRVKSIEKALSEEKNERDVTSLEAVEEFKNENVEGKIYLFGRMWIPVTESGKEVVSEVVSINAMARSKNISYEFRSEFRKPSDINLLMKILSQLEEISEVDFKNKNGFCFDHGNLRDPLTASQREHVAVFIGFDENPDLAIAFSTSAGLKNSRNLLQRNSDNSIQMDYRNNFHNLRIGPREINGIPGEEILQRVDELNGTVVHGFMWESLGNEQNVYSPNISMELSTGIGRPGQPVNSSLSDKEALALWNQISASLRLRSGKRTSDSKEI